MFIYTAVMWPLQELRYCWDGRAMLHKLNFRFRVG